MKINDKTSDFDIDSKVVDINYVRVISLSELDRILGNRTKAAALLYLQAYEEAYPSQIAANFRLSSVSMVEKQLKKLAQEGVLKFRNIGRAKVYSFNPSSAVLPFYRLVLEKALSELNEKEFLEYFNERRRPRREGKSISL